MKHFANITTVEELKSLYKEKAKELHPHSVQGKRNGFLEIIMSFFFFPFEYSILKLFTFVNFIR